MLSGVKSWYKDTFPNFSNWEIASGIAIACIAIVSSLAIMHGDSTLIEPGMQRYVAIPNYIATIFLLFQLFRRKGKITINFILLVALFISWVFDNFHLAVGIEPQPTFLLLAIFVIFCMLGKKTWHCGYIIYRLFLIVTGLAGIIGFFCFLTNIFPPLRIVEYYGFSNGPDAIYIVYPFSYLTGGSAGLRICGLFNEPGYYGTIAGLVLIAEKYNFRKFGNVIIFIAGLFTLSFAFYVLVIIFVVAFLYKSPRKILMVSLVIASIFVFVIPNVSTDSDLGALLSRFTYDSKEKKFAGDNRSNTYFDAIYDSAKIRGDLITGLGAGSLKDEEKVSASTYKVVLLAHGYLGAILIWVSLFVASIHAMPKRYYAWILIICFFASIYQRPDIYKANYLLVLFGGFMNIYYIEYVERKSIIRLNNK